MLEFYHLTTEGGILLNLIWAFEGLELQLTVTEPLPYIISIRVGHQVLVLRVVDNVEPELLLLASSSSPSTLML